MHSIEACPSVDDGVSQPFSPLRTGTILFEPSDVSKWRGCDDALSRTWSMDDDVENNGGYLTALSSLLKKKLSLSAGFCPHLRCQLGNVSDSPGEGLCPSGLCYTKLEGGARLAGSCCFIDGKFESDQILLGYSNKTVGHNKPIYSHSRVLLNGNRHSRDSRNSRNRGIIEMERRSTSANGVLDDAAHSSANKYNSFINANIVHPRVIATQCPLVGQAQQQHGGGLYVDTIDDAKQMIVEQGVKAWFQLAPNLQRDALDKLLDFEYWKDSDSICKPLALFLIDSASPYSTGVSNITVHNSDKVQDGTSSYLHISFALTSYAWPDGHLSFENASCGGGNAAIVEGESRCEGDVVKKTTFVDYYWYLYWVDFEVPRFKDDSDIMTLADIGAAIISLRSSSSSSSSSLSSSSNVSSSSSIAINCQSGRGRTGTFSALAIGRSNKQLTNSHSALVDLIVQMRGNRDGMVETPNQYRYVALNLGLGDSRQCDSMCRLSNAIEDLSSNSDLYYYYYSNIASLLIGLLLGLVFSFLSRLLRNSGNGRYSNRGDEFGPSGLGLRVRKVDNEKPSYQSIGIVDSDDGSG